jgi:acyl-CoA thioesterase
MQNHERAREVQMSDDKRLQAVNEHMQRDAFAAHLGAKVEIPEPGRDRASLTITHDMTSFHGTVHGGVVLALGDMAFAAASNSRGQVAVAPDVSISFLKACRPGDHLVAEAREEHAGRRTALYAIKVRDGNTGELVAESQKLVYRKKEWFVPA